MLWLFICCNFVLRHVYEDVYTLSANYHNYIKSKKALKVLWLVVWYNYKFLDIHIIVELHKSEVIPNVLECP